MTRFFSYLSVFGVLFFAVCQVGAQPVFNPANGHYYEVVFGDFNWYDAKAAAESMVFMGLQGHLVTITSQDENDFISDDIPLLPGTVWIGGYQPPGSPEPSGNWQWVTGEPFVYTNWAPGEPNNAGDEESIEFYGYGGWNDEAGWREKPFVVEYDLGISEPTRILIDIKPGSDPNPINPKSEGVVPVAILTTDDFDATTVDPLSVKFGPGEATECHEKGHMEDVDGDGDLDMVLHFRTQETGIQAGDTEACLTGETVDGQPIQGCDNIVTVGKSKSKSSKPMKAPASQMSSKLTTTWCRIKTE